MWIAWRFPGVHFYRNIEPPGPASGSVMVEPAGFPTPALILDQSGRSSSPNSGDGCAVRGALRRAALTTRWIRSLEASVRARMTVLGWRAGLRLAEVVLVVGLRSSGARGWLSLDVVAKVYPEEASR